jgi:hypothetical protein
MSKTIKKRVQEGRERMAQWIDILRDDVHWNPAQAEKLFRKGLKEAGRKGVRINLAGGPNDILDMYQGAVSSLHKRAKKKEDEYHRSDFILAADPSLAVVNIYQMLYLDCFALGFEHSLQEFDLLELARSGVGFIIDLGQEVILGSYPKIYLDTNARIHNPDEAAVQWPDGTHRFFWRGIEIPGEFITDPDSIDVAEIFNNPNQEVRRSLMEIVGYERIMDTCESELISEDEEGKLWEVKLSDREVVRLVEVNCFSTGRTYFLRVAPTVQTCKEGCASMVDVPVDKYKFAQRT